MAHTPEEVRRAVSETVHRRAGAVATIVTLYEPSSRSIRLAHAHGLERLVAFVDRLGLGNLVDTRVPVSAITEEEMRAFTSGRIYPLPGLHELSARHVPRAICGLVEKTFGIKAIWSMGFSWKGALYGGLTMMCRSEDPLVDCTLLEAIINLAAVALQRAYAEEEQARLREQLQQARKMEAIGRLAGGIAHDFNNLLTVINGSAEALGSGALAADPALEAEVDEIRSAAQRAADLTRQLLTFSRRELEQPAVVNPSDTIRGMSGMLRRIIGEDVRLLLDLGAGDAWVRIDPTQLSQIILNLAANARDAMPGGGTLSIRTEATLLDEAGAAAIGLVGPGPFLSLSMRDTGVGMDDHTLSRLFEPFFTTKERGQGTGLGLSMAYGAAERAGGTVQAQSAPQKGTTVTVWLPVVDRPVETAPGPTPAADAPGQPQGEVLLVEDDPAVRRYLAKLLERKGYPVHEAGSGVEALALLKRLEQPPRVMITDLVMPGMSGRALADEVRAVVPRIEILFVSGYTDDTVIRHGIAEGSVDFLRKPFSASELYEHLQRLMARAAAKA